MSVSSIYRLFWKPFFAYKEDKDKKQLFCDIDSTVNNHFIRIMKWRIGVKEPFKIHHKAFSTREVMKDMVAFDSNYWLKQFQNQNWQIHWLSARPYHLYPATYWWLKTHGFPIDSITLVPNAASKVMFLKIHRVDLFVDDLSYGQENGKIELYSSVIDQLQNLNVSFERFEGDWEIIYKKYNHL